MEEEKARMEAIKDMMIEGIGDIMQSVGDDEKARRKKIAEFLGIWMFVWLTSFCGLFFFDVLYFGEVLNEEF